MLVLRKFACLSSGAGVWDALCRGAKGSASLFGLLGREKIAALGLNRFCALGFLKER
jgi:hypothetical protein